MFILIRSTHVNKYGEVRPNMSFLTNTNIGRLLKKKIRIDTVKIDGFKFVYSECYLVSHSDGGFDYWGKGTAVTVSTGEEKLNLKSNYFFLLKTFFMNQMIRLLLSEN